MERALANNISDNIFYRCVEDCFEPIMLTDKKGILRYVNPAWTLTYGYSKEEVVGQTPRLLRSEYQDETFYRQMWKNILDPKVGFWRGEVTNQAKDGHLVPVLLTITPYREASGAIVGYMGIAVDLSENKRMEQQILRQDRLASIGMLASGLAHEIGNPLGVIRGRAEMVMMQSQDDFMKNNLEVMIGQIDRISGLINSLLRVSRVPEEVLLRQVDLGATVSEVAVLMSETLRRNGIELKLKNLDTPAFAEPNHLQQLLLNLFINSTHAIQEQKAKGTSPLLASTTENHFIEVDSSLEDGGRTCVIRVRDSGCGISATNLKRLFQPFFTTKAAGQGTGMGLAIVMKLVEEMQGQVSAESSGPGLGATFEMRLMASPPASAKPAETAARNA